MHQHHAVEDLPETSSRSHQSCSPAQRVGAPPLGTAAAPFGNHAAQRSGSSPENSTPPLS